MTTELRPWRTKTVIELGKSQDVAMPHRELIARASDRYNLGSRPDGEGAPRAWSETEANALVQICQLRNLGFEWDLIDQLVQETLKPQGLLDAVEGALTHIKQAKQAA